MRVTVYIKRQQGITCKAEELLARRRSVIEFFLLLVGVVLLVGFIRSPRCGKYYRIGALRRCLVQISTSGTKS